MNRSFLEGVRELESDEAGTEARAWSLYSLVRTLRPSRLLEVGMGYTTPFLLQALSDNVEAIEAERRRLDSPADSSGSDPARDPAGVLDPAFYARPHRPRLLACDISRQRAEEVARVAEGLGISQRLDLHVGDFRELGDRLDEDAPPFDFAFFDCGGPAEYVDFLRDFWARIESRNGVLALDFTWWTRPVKLADGGRRRMKVPGSVLNEIERQRRAPGPASGREDADRPEPGFEVLTLVEPHKLRQGSMTLIRRLPPEAAVRDVPLARDLELLGARPVDRTFELD